MLCAYYSKGCDSKELFSTCRISDDPGFEERLNKYNVIKIDMNSEYQNTINKSDLISRLTGKINKEMMNEYPDIQFNEDNSLAESILAVYSVTGDTFIILIDEYDVPLSKAAGTKNKEYYRQMLNLIRGFLSISLKTNEYLKFAVITGCLRIAKESIFTGVNNFKSYSVVDEAFSQYFGFTEKEINDLLAAANETQYAETIREWYDGYIFGNTRVYCPWDVVNFVADAKYSEHFEPKNYWKNSSGNGIIREFAEDERFQVADKFETLLNGGMITQTVSDALTYETLQLTEDNLWSVLVMTGYLTKSDPGQTGNTVALKIPNREISAIFEETVMSLFADTVDTGKVRSLTEALWNGDEQTATETLSDLLLDTISYNDYHEDYYHAFLAGIFVGRGYGVDSNKERSLGRPDIQMTDRPTRRAVIIEAKKSDSEGQMAHDCQEALQQIVDRQYAKGLKGYKQIRCYGVAFFEKSALVKLL